MTTTLTKSTTGTHHHSHHIQNLDIKSSNQQHDTDSVVVPDSTTITIEKEMVDLFCAGQDVLVKQKDDRYYFGTVVQVDDIREQCLVKYGDNTNNWSSFKDLTKLNTSKLELELLCVVCKKSAPKNQKEIIVCEQCGRGYHQKCHQPEIPNNCQKEGVTWTCKRCLDSEPYRLRKNYTKQLRRDSLRNSNTSCSSSQDIKFQTTTKVLPYELSSLTWDTYHRVNDEDTYCYCGRDGEWFKQMLQCARCKQWFHEKCIDCLQYPLYCGDRFYVYICSICNHGKEYLRRLEMKWVDLVHLMLFNLTAFNCRKYYDLDTILVPYINDNWNTLQLPPKIFNCNKTDRRDNILNILLHNRNRFKCGKEIKKRTNIWGLRVRLPPPAPCITLPPHNGQISDNELRELWQGNRRLQFLPLTTLDDAPLFNLTNKIRNIMMGTMYLQNTIHSETDSPCPSPDMDMLNGDDDLTMVASTSTASMDYKYIKKSDYLGAGCAKKSVPYKKMSLQRRKKLLAMTNRERERILKRPKRRTNNIDDVDVIKTKRSRGNNVNCYTKRLSIDSKIVNRHSETLPLTPPTSVSAPPTPPASGSTSIMSDLSNDYSEATSSTNKKKSLLDIDINTPCDTSGDETSSKSTLDLIIPPPKDFEGKNNPFLALLRNSVVEEATSSSQLRKRRSKDTNSITLPLPLTAVIPGKPLMRPMKRQLSEKDIFIGPNGEVKRKRFRRNRFIHHQTTTTASKTATVLPIRPSDAKDWTNCMEYSLNGRRLRQRPEKSQQQQQSPQTDSVVVKEGATIAPAAATPTKIPTPTTTPKPSPVKQEPNIDMDELKTSVNMYFGAANRIAAGERFVVVAKRIGPNGKLEYLIEWEGHSSNGLT